VAFDDWVLDVGLALCCSLPVAARALCWVSSALTSSWEGVMVSTSPEHSR